MALSRKPLSACPIERTICVVGGRWKAMALFLLLDGPLRYGQLRRKLSECAERVLVTQLRQLEADGVIERVALGGTPPQVQYRLTPLGESLRPVFSALHEWGRQHCGSDILLTGASDA